MKTALTWWILVRAIGSVSGSPNIVQALGPYPSEELCRVAAHEMMPDETRFMTEGQIQKRKAAEKAEAEVIESIRAGEIAKLKGKAGTIRLTEGWYEDVDEHGKPVRSLTLATSGFSSYTVSRYLPVSGCTAVRGGDKE